jgi:hypothetical protein
LAPGPLPRENSCVLRASAACLLLLAVPALAKPKPVTIPAPCEKALAAAREAAALRDWETRLGGAPATILSIYRVHEGFLGRYVSHSETGRLFKSYSGRLIFHDADSGRSCRLEPSNGLAANLASDTAKSLEPPKKP